MPNQSPTDYHRYSEAKRNVLVWGDFVLENVKDEVFSLPFIFLGDLVLPTAC